MMQTQTRIRLYQMLLAACLSAILLFTGSASWAGGQGYLPGIAVCASGGLLALLLLLRTLRQECHDYHAQRDKWAAHMAEQARLAELGCLAAEIAHELNNPLTLIREHAGWINDILDDDKEEPAEKFETVRASVVRIETQVDRASGIIKRTLGFARGAGCNGVVELCDFTADIFAMLHHKAEEKSVCLQGPASAVKVAVSDPGGLQQVLFNLINNAIDAVPAGGSVFVAVNQHAETIDIAVQDTGKGIDPALLPLIFLPFTTTKEKGKGTGLGLFLSKQLIERMHGTLTASNSPDGGALFSVRLPCREH